MDRSRRLIGLLMLLAASTSPAWGVQAELGTASIATLADWVAGAEPEQRDRIRRELLARTAQPAEDRAGHQERWEALELYYLQFGASGSTEELIEMLGRGLDVQGELGGGAEGLLLHAWQWCDQAEGAEPASRLLPVLRFLLERCPGEPSALVPALWSSRGVFERELGDYAGALRSLAEGLRRIAGLTGQVDSGMEVWMSGHRPFIEAERFIIQLELGLLSEASNSLEAQSQAVAQLAESPAWAGLGVEINRARLAYFRGRQREGRDGLAGPAVQALLERFEEQDPRGLPAMAALVDLWRAICSAGLGKVDRKRARSEFSRLLDGGLLGSKDAAQARRHLAELMLGDGEPEAALRLLPRSVSLSNRRTTLDVVKYRSLRAKAARHAGWEGERLRPLLEDLEQSYGDFLRIWAACPRPPSGVGFLQYPDRRSIVAELIEQHLSVYPRRAGRVAALGALLQAQACGTLSMELAAAPGDLERIRTELLGEGGGLLAILAGPEASHLLALDGRGLVHRRLPGEESLRRGLRGLLPFRPQHDQQGRVAPTELERLAKASRAQGQRWFDAQLVRRISGWQRVYMTGAESLGMAAVEGLALGEGGARLGSLPLVHLPSIAWALARRSEGVSKDPGSIVVMAAPKLDALPELDPIGLTEGEARSWLAPFPAERAHLFFGTEATREQLAGDAVRGAQTLVFYTHGGHYRDRERPSSLWLARDLGGPEPLFAEDIEALFSMSERPAPRTVILAACGTQRGPLRLGEDGVQHLGGAFLRSGSACVLLSASDLDQQATQVLLGLLFEQLQRPGATPAAAMAAARAALADDPRWAHPYYYGQLTILGLGHGRPNP